MSPVTDVAPVFVIPEPARMAKESLVPSRIDCVAASAGARGRRAVTAPPTNTERATMRERRRTAT